MLMWPTIWGTISKSVAHPCVVIDVLEDVWARGKVDIDVSIGVWIGVLIAALNDVSVSVKVVVETGIGVDTLADINANILAVAMVALEFIMSTLLKESVFCR